MGNTMQCQIVENDEELINNILSTMILSEIDCSTAYNKYLSCLHEKSSHLKQEDFNKFINAILGNSKYRQYQEQFLHNLQNAFPDEIVIGSLVIFLSKGAKEEKTQLLLKHYKTNSSFIPVQQFIVDIIKANTTYCISTFNNCINKANHKTMQNIYSDERIDVFTNWIMKNYMELNTKSELKRYKSEGDIMVNLEEMDEIIDKTMTGQDMVLKEFFDITYEQLKGEYIRNWIYDEYLKEIPNKTAAPCE